MSVAGYWVSRALKLPMRITTSPVSIVRTKRDTKQVNQYPGVGRLLVVTMERLVSADHSDTNCNEHLLATSPGSRCSLREEGLEFLLVQEIRPFIGSFLID